MPKYFIVLFLALSLVAAFCLQALARANVAEPVAAAETGHLIDNGGYAVQKNGITIVGHNQHTPYVPASIIKIATALAALDVLGPSFRFDTSFYRDARDNLYIKGFGDPFLVSEEVVTIVGKLKELGCPKINNIYLDNTAFHLEGSADGSGLSDNPYDAQNSALAVNFNSVKITKYPTGSVVSGEEQTPTLQLMQNLAEDLEPGDHRINITRGQKVGDSIISRYVGELLRALQKKINIAGEGTIEARRTPENLEPFYVHRSSKTLKDIIEPLMLYSNNFIANQLFLVLGAEKYGYPATWEKGRTAVTGYLHDTFNMTGGELKIIEGSGLSRRNRISAHAMMQLLDAFKPYAGLLPQEDDKLFKSGTLKGVYTYAGYFMENGSLDGFVLLLNQRKNNRDKVLSELERIYRSN